MKWGRAPLQEELGEAVPCACGVVLRDSIVLPAACVRARGVVLCSVFMQAASSCVHVRVVSLCSCARGVVVPCVLGVVVPCATCMRVMESSGLGLKDGEVSEAMKKSERAMMDKRGRTIQFCGLWLTGACCRHQHVLC